MGAGRTFRTIEEAFEALKKGQVQSVVYDLAVAQKQIEASEETLRIVETVSTDEQYGMTFPEDSDLVEPVN